MDNLLLFLLVAVSAYGTIEACKKTTPVHCQWNNWAKGKCSEPCGTGTRTLTRSKKVVERDGGTCSGSSRKTERCKIKECPVHCEWDAWQYGYCSKICGGGTRTVTRKEKVSAKHGGYKCSGNKSVQEGCNNQECPVDCKWGDWVPGECSAVCGGGKQPKLRIKEKEALFGGKECEGPAHIEVTCNTQCCPEPCEWGDWQFGKCSATCGGGKAIDTRKITKKAACHGQCDLTAYERVVDCNTHICPPIHCEWDKWTQGKCSEDCGTGTRTNTRTKNIVEKDLGTCTGKPTQIEVCKLKECPVHCEWDEWQIGECSETCGGGKRTNTRVEKVSAEHGGTKCKGLSSITEDCNVDIECPVNCEWDAWVFGKCSVDCGGGSQHDYREKKQQELFGGTCEGEATKEEECNKHDCPVPCEWGTWNLGECSATCAGGIRKDTREIVQKALYGATLCDPTGHQREEPCNTHVCPPIHCEWNDWVSGDCSEPCGTGLQINTRTKKVVEKDGGTCTGQPNEELVCKIKECPVHCEWDEWQIGQCSESCGGGTRTNTRVEKVSADHGGTECKGLPSITEDCNVDVECPVDCKWNEYVLGHCSTTCGDGVLTKTRTKVDAQFGGLPCEGELSMEEACPIVKCPPIHCKWDHWIIGECSEQCGTGTRTNTRTKKIVEKDGGTCTGQDTEVEECKIKECPVHCEWGRWRMTLCDKSCGGGMQTKTRTVSQEAAHGGDECTGETTLDVSCNVEECPCPKEKTTWCSTYARMIPQYCVEKKENDWFLGADGQYSCKKACGLC